MEGLLSTGPNLSSCRTAPARTGLFKVYDNTFQLYSVYYYTVGPDVTPSSD